MRVLTSTVGIYGVYAKGWKECAKSNETLTIPLVEDLIDKQSVANARTHISVQVENWRDHGFCEAAELTTLIREPISHKEHEVNTPYSTSNFRD